MVLAASGEGMHETRRMVIARQLPARSRL